MNINTTDPEIAQHYELQRHALIEKDAAALAELYEGGLRVVMKLVHRYENQGASYSDLVLAGFQGFCDFMAKPTAQTMAGTKDFSTFSTQAMRSGMTKIITPPERSFVEE